MSGVGIDLLEIDRMERALERRPSLAERLFTPAERRSAQERARPARHLAARFCAKEAVVKALALTAWDPHDIEVVGGGDGPPAIALRGSVAAVADALGMRVEISLTHSRDTAGAVALLVPATGNREP
jgi:holo-[acyl-carrier protein] synthase